MVWDTMQDIEILPYDEVGPGAQIPIYRTRELQEVGLDSMKIKIIVEGFRCGRGN